METILAAMDPSTTHFSGGMHALDLARRINARVLFLLIHSSGVDQVETAVQKKLVALVEEARADGVTVEQYVTHGHFESELISFARERRITLLVIESPIKRDDTGGTFLDRLRHRLHCRIEVVNEKPDSLKRKE